MKRPCFVHQPVSVFFIFNIYKAIKVLAAEDKNSSNSLILRMTACMETFFPICWHHFFEEKSTKVLRKPSSET
jgi:hypothetical protein